MKKTVALLKIIEGNLKIGSFDSLEIAKHLCGNSKLGKEVNAKISEILDLKNQQVLDPGNRTLDSDIQTGIDDAVSLLAGNPTNSKR